MASNQSLCRVAMHLAALPLLCALSAQSYAQTYVERAAQLGINHKFQCGLDRIGNLSAMLDWSQQGTGIGDLDGDGDLDIVAVSRLGQNHVYRNDGGGFTDITTAAGIETGEFDNSVALGDYDKDGDLDLFLGSLTRGEGATQAFSRLYRNNGSAVFEDVTVLSGTKGAGQTIYAKWFDIDRDGWLDLLTAEFNGTPNHFYRNLGDGSFLEQGVAFGLNAGGSTHQLGVLDSDQDGDWDVLIGSDWKVSNAAGMNNNIDDAQLAQKPDGTFEDVSALAGGLLINGLPNHGAATMGMSFGDVNYDGLLDSYRTEVDTQFLTLNFGWPTSGLPWVQAQDAYGVKNELVPVLAVPGTFGSTVGWGCAFFDADFDLWLDLFKVNGHISSTNPRLQQNYLFRGTGVNTAFQDVTAAYGLLDNWDDRGLAIGDLDADGDIDLLVAPPSDKLRYFENRLPRNGMGWLSVEPVCKTSAPGGAGVEVSFVDSTGLPHVRSIGADGNTASSSQLLAYFGLGFETAVDLTVEFPSGMVLQLPNVTPNQRLMPVEPELLRLSSNSVPAALAGGSTGSPTGGLSKSHSRFSVTAFAHSQNGRPLGPNANVEIEIAGLQPASPVQSLGGNKFQRSFEIPSLAGEYAATVRFNGWEPRTHPKVQVTGTADLSKSSLELNPLAVRAGSSDTVEINVAPKDALGRSLGKGHSVSAGIAGVTGLVPLADLGDGRYRGTFAAPGVESLYNIDLQIDGAVQFGKATLDVGGQVSVSQTLVYTEKPAAAVALAPTQFKLLVTPRDFLGTRLGPKANVTLVITPNVGTQPVTLNTSLGANSQVDGEFVFVVERPANSTPGSAKGSIKVVVDGNNSKTVTYDF